MQQPDIFTQKNHDGSLLLTAIIGNQYYKMKYIGHSKKVAKQKFRKYLKQQHHEYTT